MHASRRIALATPSMPNAGQSALPLSLDAAELSRLARTVQHAALGAGEIVRNAALTSSSLVWEHKGTADFVSEVDRDAEQHILSVIEKEFPGAVVIGEEFSPDAVSGRGLSFIIDPLDGKTNFLHGFPHYAVSIGAAHGADLLAAAVLNVPTRELFAATAGGGATRDGAPIRASTETVPQRALIGTGFPFKQVEHLPGFLRQFEAVTRSTAGVRRAGSAALDLADTACGRFDAFWELGLAPWDVAAGILLIREAGGLITDLEGAHATPAFGAYVAGGPAMHEWLSRTLKEAGAGSARHQAQVTSHQSLVTNH
ncbi:MAG: inositol monophosphatase family protein [Gemmatimonadaceae bacterium]